MIAIVANQNKYTPEFKRETADYIIAAVAEGRSIKGCCEELGLSDRTVGKWVADRRRELGGEPAPEAAGRELRDAQRRIRELEMENAFLKKAAAFFASDRL